jgi:acetylornithine deacetylase
MRLAIGHKGFAWLDIITRGRAAHGSRPEEGRDAIARMGRVLVVLEQRDRALRARPVVPFQGTGSLHASIISGGAELSSYPASCLLQMERRTVAGESGESVTQEIDEILDTLRGDDPEFEGSASLVGYRPAYVLDTNHRLAATVRDCLTQARLAPEATGMSFWTDAAILADAGIPSVLFGPGGAGLHSREEYVLIDDVRVCRDVLVDVARRLVA